MIKEVLKEIITGYPAFLITGIDDGYKLEFCGQTLNITEEDLKYITQITPIYKINANEFVGIEKIKDEIKEDNGTLLYYKKRCEDIEANIARLNSLERVKL